MAEEDKSGRKNESQDLNAGGESRKPEREDEPTGEDPQRAEGKKKKRGRQKKRNKDLKSKATGVGLKISVDGDSTPANKKIVFDDSNLPSDDDNDADATNDQHKDESSKPKDSIHDEGNNEDDEDDAVEEVKGKTARDDAMDQLETEAKQSLKTKKKRKRKQRKQKVKEANASDDEDMDADFFAQLDSVRKEEFEERKKLDQLAAREASKGKHTTFVFEKNQNDNEAMSDPVQIDENIQVVVLENPSSSSQAIQYSSFPSTSNSEKALMYSRNRLINGTDRGAGAEELKRKRNRSGPSIEPWKRARQKLSMGRSRLTKGKPAAFFKKKKR